VTSKADSSPPGVLRGASVSPDRAEQDVPARLWLAHVSEVSKIEMPLAPLRGGMYQISLTEITRLFCLATSVAAVIAFNLLTSTTQVSQLRTVVYIWVSKAYSSLGSWSWHDTSTLTRRR
jgi:hypothetical protein